MSYNNSSQSCPKHPDQKLTLLNTQKGLKQCPLCVVKDSLKSQNPELKNRYCQKHSGYELLFFCEQDLKGVCEKCLDMHESQGHQVQTIALQARHCKKLYTSFKSNFMEILGHWEQNYQRLEKVKGQIHLEIDTVQEQIAKVFDNLIQVIQNQKREMQNEYQLKCEETYSSFDRLYKDSYKKYQAITLMRDDIEKMELIYGSLNDYDLIKENIVRKHNEIFENHCEQIDGQLKEIQETMVNIQKNISYKYDFNIQISEKEIRQLVDKNFQVITLQVEDAFQFFEQLSPQKTQFKKEQSNNSNKRIVPSPNVIKEYNQPMDEEQSQIYDQQSQNQFLNIQENNSILLNHQSSSQMIQLRSTSNLQNLQEEEEKQLFPNETTQDAIIVHNIRLSNVKPAGSGTLGNIKRLNSINQQKLFKGSDQFMYQLDRTNQTLRFLKNDSAKTFNLQNSQSLKDMKTLHLNGSIYLFESTDQQFSQNFLHFNQDKKQFQSIPKTLAVPRRKISMCSQGQRFLYFISELESIKADRAMLERYDTQTQNFEEIYGLSSNQGNFIITIVNDRLLYAIPIMINTQKIQVLDLKQLDEILSFSQNKRAYMHPTKPDAFIPKWLKINHKLPNNFRVALNSKSYAIQVNYEEILITGSKTSFIYNFRKEEFTHYINNAVDDEFLDGLYKNEGNTTQVFGFGSQGLHIFDCMARKWTLYDELAVKQHTF
eukprot:403331710